MDVKVMNSNCSWKTENAVLLHLEEVTEIWSMSLLV